MSSSKFKFFNFFILFGLHLLTLNTAFATPRIEIDKYACRFFYRPDNTYSINYSIDIYNTSTAGEILRNIQVADNMATTFGNASRVVSASIVSNWGEQGDTTIAWNWDWTNFTNWNGRTVTNMFNNGTNSISTLQLHPGGYIHLDFCVIVKADNLPTGIGSGNNYTNTTTFVSAQTTAGVNLNAGNVGNTYTPGTTNATTITPIRSRSIITASMLATPEYPSVALNGSYTFDYFIKYQHHPNVVANPDGATGAANPIDSYFGLWGFINASVPVQSISVTKVYGPSTISLISGYNGNMSTINGVAVSPQEHLFTGSLGVSQSVMIKVSITAGPVLPFTTTWEGPWADFNDAAGVYQVLPGAGESYDTINNPYAQCRCMYAPVRFTSTYDLSATKSVISTTCVPGAGNKEDVVFEFVVTGNASSNVWLRNLSLKDDLNVNSCGSFQGVVSAPTIVASTATSPPTINSGYNGSTNTEIFVPAFANKLGPNEYIRVRLTARYASGSMCLPSQTNTVTATGSHPVGVSKSVTSAAVTIPRSNCCTMTVSLGPAQTACPGNSITLTPNITNGAPSYTYTWNNSLGTGSPKTVSPVTTTTYSVTVQDAASCTATAAVPITVVADPTISASGAVNVCVGGTTTLSANVSGGSGTNSYQWQRRVSPAGAWANVGTNSSTYITDGTLTANNYDYQVIVTQSGPGCAGTSAAVAANVVADPLVSISATATTVCVGGGVTLNSSVTGGTGSCPYQWQSSPDGTTWSDISGANGANYTTPALSSALQYRVILNCTTSGCCN